MLRIVSKPEDFTPIKEGLLFVVEADEKCDLDVAIINAYTGEEVGRKVIYDTMRAVVDIAPYVADMPQFAPSKQGETELMSLPVISYMIVAQSADEVVESDEVLVSNNIVAEKVGVNSIFAVDECREITYGQSDHLLIKAPAAGMITAEVSADYGESYSYNVYPLNIRFKQLRCLVYRRRCLNRMLSGLWLRFTAMGSFCKVLIMRLFRKFQTRCEWRGFRTLELLSILHLRLSIVEHW